MIQHQNRFLQDRNMYVMDGWMMVITRYHKLQSQFDTLKVVPRFLLWWMRQLMTVYLSYVRPFTEHLTVQMHSSGFSDHLWADSRRP